MPKHHILSPITLTAALAFTPATAFAGDGPEDAGSSGEAGVGVSADASGVDASAEADKPRAKKTKRGHEGMASEDPKRLDVPWIKRWAPEPRMAEVGGFVGIALIAPDHELYELDLDRTDAGWREIDRVNANLGFRAGFYPKRHLGLEADLNVMPLTLPEANGAAFGYGVRAQIVAQLGLWSVTPFLTFGAGALSVVTKREILGSDADEAVHIGAGVKFFLTRRMMLRFDFRNDFTAKRFVNDGGTSHQELTLGLSATLGRKMNKGPDDTDGDGFLDPVDKCPRVVGVADYQGCPVPDTDGDGFYDDVDECIDEVGVEAYQGCPVPDTDGDGFLDDVDQCVDEAGVEPDGCPIRDTDGDGLYDDVDECPEQPETQNGFKDSDGCPDEVPEEVARFSGVIEGIYFDTGKSTIKDESTKILDQALDVLRKYESVRLEVSGHTDARGDEAKNMTLSSDRAGAVRQYLIDAGIAGDRLETIGWGPFKPVDSNKTNYGRGKNRRIEFRLLRSGDSAPSEAERQTVIDEAKAAGVTDK